MSTWGRTSWAKRATQRAVMALDIYPETAARLTRVRAEFAILSPKALELYAEFPTTEVAAIQEAERLEKGLKNERARYAAFTWLMEMASIRRNTAEMDAKRAGGGG